MNEFFQYFLLFSIVFLSQYFTETNGNVMKKDLKIACRDEKGNNVDWYYLYKLPKRYSIKSDNERSGLDYLYMTSKKNNQWYFGKRLISDKDSMPGLTLEPYYKNRNSYLMVAYNDEFPNGTVKSTAAHAKGIIVSDIKRGFWLIHSVPKYPSTNQYKYPSSGLNYGQSFLCISFRTRNFEKIALELYIDRINTYDYKIPTELHNKFPSLELALQRKWDRSMQYKIVTFNSTGGTEFKIFAKSSTYDEDLYKKIMAPNLNTNLLVETWRNGGGNFLSNCSFNRKVYNVNEIESKEYGLSFKSSQDHSKWAVSQNIDSSLNTKAYKQSTNWICVGDINRQQGQLNRGGGQICQQNRYIATQYRTLIHSYEKCEYK